MLRRPAFVSTLLAFAAIGWLFSPHAVHATPPKTPTKVAAESAASDGEKSIQPVIVTGLANVNGNDVAIQASGSYDSLTGAYTLDGIAANQSSLSAREKFLLALLPRVALGFVDAPGRIDLLANSSSGGLTVGFTARRKVDEVSSVTGNLSLSQGPQGLLINVGGAITAPADRPIEADGEAALRFGVNPSDGTFVGMARINYDTNAPDPGILGTADFWNLSGTFNGARASATDAYAHVDHTGGAPASGLAQGTILSFPSSTVVLPGIITLSGVAQSDGVIHQFLGFANPSGGGRTILQFPVAIETGMRAHEVAALIADGFNQARINGSTPEARYLLAVQGGDGVSTIPDATSPQVAVSITLDGGQTIANPSDPGAAAVFSSVSTQNFSDQLVLAADNTGIRNQFGVLGQPPLTGWLTPFKAVFTTDNPATGYRAGGGEVSILLNWSESLPGTSNGGLPGSLTSFTDLEISTYPGDTAEEIVSRATHALKGQITAWGGHAFFQRQGNVLFIDAGIDAPHSVSLKSTDAGVGYMSAAADLPSYPEPGI